MNTKDTIIAIANRFKEPSSWAGIGAIFALIGLHISAVEVGYIVNIGVGVCGLLAFFLPEVSK